jgi:hypothetical protein
MFVIFNMKEFCMFAGMSIIHSHNKCHTTPWNYSVLIILTIPEQKFIQNSHAYSVLHTTYTYTYIYTYSVMQYIHLRFSYIHLLVRNPNNLKLKNQLMNSNIYYDATHTPHSHKWSYT